MLRVCAVICWLVAALAVAVTVFLFDLRHEGHGIFGAFYLVSGLVVLVFAVLGYACWPASEKAHRGSANEQNSG